MGNKASNESIKSKKLSLTISRSKKTDSEKLKLLLLGAGESGKSTILKQMKLIHAAGYTSEDRKAHRQIIYSNTVQSMSVILDAMDELGIEYEKEESKPHAELIASMSHQIEDDAMPENVTAAIKTLWADSGIQACFARSAEYQLNDSASYYFEAIDRISDPAFIPTDQDILRSRVKTTGIVESNFKVGKLNYKMYDVGGQRSERKKWIHCFEEVTAIVFMAAISEYDQKLVEDETVNRMQEALTLFDSICNSRWFLKTSIILFLNKIDLFKLKLSKMPLKNYYPEFTGGEDFEAAKQYILKQFMSLNKNPDKTVYPHFTCATDTTQIKFVMSAVNDIIIQSNLQSAGLV